MARLSRTVRRNMRRRQGDIQIRNDKSMIARSLDRAVESLIDLRNTDIGRRVNEVIAAGDLTATPADVRSGQWTVGPCRDDAIAFDRVAFQMNTKHVSQTVKRRAAEQEGLIVPPPFVLVDIRVIGFRTVRVYAKDQRACLASKPSGNGLECARLHFAPTDAGRRVKRACSDEFAV